MTSYGPGSRRTKIAELISRLLPLLLADLDDPNLEGTPQRVAKAFVDEWCVGYTQSAENVITSFPNTSKSRDLVLVKDIPFFSLCAHHLAPFHGKAAIGYIPGERVLGLSKMSRILEVYARRLQLQEYITQQVADALDEYLQPEGVMVVLYNVEHTCMTSRGVKAHGAVTTTSAIRGNFETDSALRAELLSLL